MRTGVLLWSTLSGVILGLFVDATLIGVALLLNAIVPSLGVRSGPRWLVALAIIVLTLIPMAAAVIGFLEGRLKAS